MWEFWRTRWSKEHTKRRRDTVAAVEDGKSEKSDAKDHHVNFKDLKLPIHPPDDTDSDDQWEHEGARDGQTESGHEYPLTSKRPRKFVERSKLIIIMVGLPGRGKTFLCNKLASYLNWLGHSTTHINVGSYRRQLKDGAEIQSATFFDHKNQAGMEARKKALEAALDDLEVYLMSDEGQVAIFDATNSTEERRQFLIKKFHGRYQYMFLESICNDEDILEQNYRQKMRYSPDYAGVDTEEALQDFKDRIKNYAEVYEPISSRNLHYIKLIDMVTGRGHMDVNRISGYLPGKIVFFLMQVCKSGIGQGRKLWLSRHGESEYNRLRLLGGDSPLSPKGEEFAKCLPEVLDSRLHKSSAEDEIPLSVWTSTLRRTIQTASHLHYPKLRWKALDELDAGICDGMSYEEIQQSMPDSFEARKRDKLRYRYPSGESYLDVIQRLEPVIIEMEREKESIMIVAHQAVLRVIYGYCSRQPLEKIPTLEIPLHTLIELTPMPDGTMQEERFPLDIATPPSSPPPVPPVRWFRWDSLAPFQIMPDPSKNSDEDELTLSMGSVAIADKQE